MFNVMWDLFVAFSRASNLGFGGGPAVIPLIQEETVERYSWLTNEEFTDALAVSNALPGPIATKMSAYIGYKVAGWPGVVAGMLGTVVPTALAVILLSGIIMKYADAPWLKGMLKAVRPVVVILVAQTAWDMGRKSFPTLSTWVIAAVAILALHLFKIHPAIIIVAAMILGLVAFR